MELKRILARDSRAANEKAMQLYGQDVLIISSQRLDNQTELIVAVDLDAAPEAVVAEPGKAGEPVREEVDAPFVPFSKLFQSASAFAPLPPEESLPEAVKPVEVAAVSQAVLSVPAASGQPNAHELQYEGQRSQEIVALLRQEMAALRKEFSLSRQMVPWQDGLRLSPAIQQLSLAMSEVGVPAGLRALLTDSIQSLETMEEALPVMQNLLVDALARPVIALPDSGVHALCGPSGSGKTSMVGRLAFAAAQVHGAENQAMVSFADQRPGAWAQMQLLAAQSGVACFRAANSDMLHALLEDLEGKTVWIDTCGSDFSAQAGLLLNQHPKVLRHAVLPVDATVTSVQKILQNSALNWTSLMLTKVDEAAYPWALIKGLSEQSLRVSCMVGASRIDQACESFDPVRLVQMALKPLMENLPESVMPQVMPQAVSATPASTGPVVRSSRPKKPAVAKTVKARSESAAVVAGQRNSQDDIVIPTLLGSTPMMPSRRRAASASKVANG